MQLPESALDSKFPIFRLREGMGGKAPRRKKFFGNAPFWYDKTARGRMSLCHCAHNDLFVGGCYYIFKHTQLYPVDSSPMS